MWRPVVVFALALVASLCLPFRALAQETGTITGRVANIATGEYLEKARITIKGTDTEVFTDRFGEFQIYEVPAGSVTITVFYTGLDPKDVTITVDAGGVATQEISLTSLSRYGTEDEAVALDEFVIQSTRETNAQAIAQNEQRFSPNLKNVVSSDSFGDVTEGNVGEFMKYLPGVTVDYVAADVRTMSVRGFADNFTSIAFNGSRMASANSGGNSRAFEFEQVSINNISRIEVSKVPTPDMGADSLGGSINMIPKSAFERKGSDFRYRAYASMNSENLAVWEKTPGPGDKMSYKTHLGADFDWTVPVNDKFGFVLTGLTSNQFNEQHRSQPLWNFAQGGGTIVNPYLQTYQLQDGPKRTWRDSISIRADYKLAPGQVLSLGIQTNYYSSFFGNRNITWDVGTTSTATTSGTTGGTVARTWGPTFSRGASGRGVATHGYSFRDKNGGTRAADLNYRFTGQFIELNAGLSGSISKTWYRDMSNGHFNSMGARLRNVSRVNFLNISEPRPDVIETLTSNGTPIAWQNLNEWTLQNGDSNKVDGRDEFITMFGNAKYVFDGLPFYFSAKAGFEIRNQTRDIERERPTYTFVGADGVANTFDDVADRFLDTRYGVDPGWGFKQQIQWISPYRAYEDLQKNPGNWRFYATENSRNEANAERYRRQNSYDLEETITAGYLRFDARLLENKLNLTFGARYELTEDTGNGALFIGPTVRNPAPTTTAQYLEELDLVRTNLIERGLHADKDYDDIYPSLNVAYNVTDDIILRLGYAQTLGRPDFSTILPLQRVNDTDAVYNDGIGNINPYTAILNNTGLNPWEGTSYDIALEYYAPTGTTVTAGMFYKEIEGFFATQNWAATPELIEEFNLQGYDRIDTITTALNLDTTSTISGTEFTLEQPLAVLGDWAKGLRMRGNITALDLDGDASADFRNFIPKTGSLSLTYSVKPIVVMVKWNYRGTQRRAAQTGNQYGGAANSFYEFYRPRRDVDINVEYQFSKKFGMFVNARNIFESPQQLERRPSDGAATQSPAYSHLYNMETYGVQITVGVKGRF
jgi:TonB-dependent receptor